MTGHLIQNLLSIVEIERNVDGSFGARVEFGAENPHHVTIADPAGPSVENEFAWYFQDHIRMPFVDHDRRAAAAARITEYGTALFRQVFAGDAGAKLESLRRHGFDGCQIVIDGSAAFHRLHWEALREPGAREALSLRMPIVRRVTQNPSAFALPPARPTLNVLVVTARPAGVRDVGYRTISRPLLAALRQARLPVTVDLLRPGTWQGLREHLDQVTERHGSGYYQVVHFDLHGAVTDHARLGRVVPGRPSTIDLSGLSAYDGDRAFLFFETDRDGVARPVVADDVARLLARHRVAVAVLNACQTAMDTGTEASLAQQLVEAGLPVAVGMAWSITVSAAERAMSVIYGRLADDGSPVRAIYHARRSLDAHRGRQAHYEQRVDLEDWLLPVAFEQRPIALTVAPMSTDQSRAHYEREGRDEAEPVTEYRFVGRDLDIHTIERRLLLPGRPNLLLVDGMAGAGKSTLLRHLSWWWRRTGLVDRAFHLSFEDRAWTADQIARQVATELLDETGRAALDELPAPARAQRVAALLRADRHLLVLDNLESVTASPGSVPHTLDQPARDELRAFLRAIRGGRTLVLLGSREAEQWLAAETFGDNTHTLAGLDPQAASQLVERILHRHNATHHYADTTERKALAELVTALDRYPLPMTVVLPTLDRAKPSTVLAELRGGRDPDRPADDVGTSDKHSLMELALAYSHDKLEPRLQAAMLLLAPFVGTIAGRDWLDRYAGLLPDDRTGTDLREAVAAAVRAGLAANHPDLGDYAVRVQPLLPLFLRTRLRGSDLWHALEQAHYRLFASFADEVYGAFHGTAPERATGRLIVDANYANLNTAMKYALHGRLPVVTIVLVLYEYLDQTRQESARRDLLDGAIAAFPVPITAELRQELADLHNLAGVAAARQRRFDDAERHHQAELTLLPATADPRRVAIIQAGLGAVAEGRRRLPAAADHYTTAHDILIAADDQRNAARMKHQLGRIAQEMGDLVTAEKWYLETLSLFTVFNDRQEAADVHHQLGVIRRDMGNLREAAASLHRAMTQFQEFGEQFKVAQAQGNLALTAQFTGDLTTAERLFRAALGTMLRLGGPHDQAMAQFQLGTLLLEQGRLDEADRLLKIAYDMFAGVGDELHAGRAIHNRGGIAYQRDDLDAAERLYRQAITHKMAGGDPNSAESTRTNLRALLAEKRRRS